MKKVYVSFFIICFIFIWSSSDVSADKNTIYYINKDGVFVDEDRDLYKSMRKDILKTKSISVSEEVKRLGVDYFSDSSIKLDLFINDSKTNTLWSMDLKKLEDNTTPMYVTLHTGGAVFKLYIPTKNDSKASLSETLQFLEDYKDTVKESIAVSSLYGSVNVFTLIPSKQYALKDIMKEALDNNGKKLGYKEFDTSKARITYKLDYFYNPILGRLERKDFKDEEDLIKKAKKAVNLIVEDNNLYFGIDDDYLNFVSQLRSSDSPFIKVKGFSEKTDGVGSFKYSRNGRTYTPVNVTNASFYMVVPYLFVKKDSGGYGVASNEGYKVIKGFRLLPSTNHILKEDSKGFKKVGDLASFGIDIKDLYLSQYTMDKEKIGVIVPLGYKEVVKNTLPIGDGLYYTGRFLRFGNDYSGKLKLNDKNKDIFSVETKTISKVGIEIRNFAFLPKANINNAVDHVGVSAKEGEFKVEIDFIDTDVARGFVMYRNNAYIDSKEFLDWLDSSTAKSMTDVKAEELLKLIKGDLKVDSQELTYEDWKRIDEIKKELEFDKKGKFLYLSSSILVFIGWLIGVYANILVLVYFIDINLNLEKPILTVLTFNRYFPISNKDIDLVGRSSGYKYISLKGVLLLWFIYMSVMLLLVFNDWFLSWIIWFYYVLTS